MFLLLSCDHDGEFAALCDFAKPFKTLGYLGKNDLLCDTIDRSNPFISDNSQYIPTEKRIRTRYETLRTRSGRLTNTDTL